MSQLKDFLAYTPYDFYKATKTELCRVTGCSSGSSGLTSVSTLNSTTISLSGDGTALSPLSASLVNPVTSSLLTGYVPGGNTAILATDTILQAFQKTQGQINNREALLTFSTGLTRTTNTVTNNLSTGVAGGQTAIGGTASGNNLTLSSTSNATKGKILFGTSGYDEVNNRLGVGTNSPTVSLQVIGPIKSGTTGTIGRLEVARSSDGLTIGVIQASGSNMNIDAPGGPIVFLPGSVQAAVLMASGAFGLGQVSPTAILHLKAGTATANTAPLKFATGVNLTTPENGAVEYDGTNYFVTSGAVRHTLAKTLTNTAALDFPSTNAQNSSDLTITVTGAALGDAVVLGVPFASVNANSNFSAFVSATNTVTVRFNNYSAAPIDPASATFRVSVLKY